MNKIGLWNHVRSVHKKINSVKKVDHLKRNKGTEITKQNKLKMKMDPIKNSSKQRPYELRSKK